MGPFAQALLNAQAYMPLHRKIRGRRATTLSLDDLLDEGRVQTQGTSFKIDESLLDLVLMAYRYRGPFDSFWKKFFGEEKSLRPPHQLDLFSLGFAAALTRDNTPFPVLVNECVEAHKRAYGVGVGGLANAFYRGLGREKDSLKESLKLKPESFLSEETRSRWKNNFELLFRAGSQISQRPEPGIWAFDLKTSEFKKIPANDFKSSEKYQAIDPGSWMLSQWICEQLPQKDIRGWDLCAAPGGKSLALASLWENQNLVGRMHLTLSELKMPRFERLRSNVERAQSHFSRTKLEPQCLDARLNALRETPNAELLGTSWDFLLLDLPCSGSGTWATRPDLIFSPWNRTLSPDLRDLQKNICQTAAFLKRKNPHIKVFVSTCSVDPEENLNLRGYFSEFKTQSEFFSWNQNTALCEGIHAFCI